MNIPSCYRYKCYDYYRIKKADRYTENGGCHAKIEISFDYKSYRIVDAKDKHGRKATAQHNCINRNKTLINTGVAFHEATDLSLPDVYRQKISAEEVTKENETQEKVTSCFENVRLAFNEILRSEGPEVIEEVLQRIISSIKDKGFIM